MSLRSKTAHSLGLSLSLAAIISPISAEEKPRFYGSIGIGYFKADDPKGQLEHADYSNIKRAF